MFWSLVITRPFVDEISNSETNKQSGKQMTKILPTEPSAILLMASKSVLVFTYLTPVSLATATDGDSVSASFSEKGLGRPSAKTGVELEEDKEEVVWDVDLVRPMGGVSIDPG